MCKRVSLRTIVEEDLVLLNKWKNDVSVYKYLGGGYMPTSISTQEKWMDNIMDTSGSSKRFIIESEDGISIGMIGLYKINSINRNCEIGIFIGEESAKGKGYAREACESIESFAKNYLNIRKIKLNVVEENQAAFNLWKSLGYIVVGKLIEERFIDGFYKNLLIMEKFINV